MMDVRVVVRTDAVRRFARSDSVASYLLRVATKKRIAAQVDAPVSPSGSHGRPPGHLRSWVQVRYGEDALSAYADVVTRARSPRGFPYGALQERRQPYIRPQFRDV